MIIIYPNDGRKLRYLINILLKSKLIDTIKKINYVKSYSIQESKIIKKEEKILILDIKENNTQNQQKILGIIQKNNPDAYTIDIKDYFSKHL